MKKLLVFALLLAALAPVHAADYHVGPGQSYTDINDVPWESMNAGDNVYIHYRNMPYYSKWVINVQGTAAQPFSVIGLSGPNGERPVISGDGATTRTELDYWNEDRSIIKIGGSSVPADGLPSHIIIENLEIRSAHPDYTFTTDNGNTSTYANNAASIFVEKADHLTVRNCVLHDSGNGLFTASQSSNILIEKNLIYGNGIAGGIFEHNAYTESDGITYQYNRFGALRPEALGNNLKDRSSGLVVRYNWIEGGNRLLDLVDSGNASIRDSPDYNSTYVYGNILIEEDGGNNQVIHYGGDNGNTANYRKGKLYFYNNTLYSVRAGNTTLMRLSTNEESADVRNNILYVTAEGDKLAFLESSGTVDVSHNLLKPAWRDSHSSAFNGTVNEDGTSIEQPNPEFKDAGSYDFSLDAMSPAIDVGTTLHPDINNSYEVNMEYVIHQGSRPRATVNTIDIGAYEFEEATTAISTYLQEINITLFPNPTHDSFTLSSGKGWTGITSLSLYSQDGKLIVQRLLGALEDDLLWDLSALPNGVYFVKVYQNDHPVKTLQVVKSN
jgi:hypothetical protein